MFLASTVDMYFHFGFNISFTRVGMSGRGVFGISYAEEGLKMLLLMSLSR